MAATTVVQVIVTAIDQATGVINSVGKSMTDVSGDVKKGADIVTGASLAMGAALIAGAGVSVKMAMDFQSSMEMIRTQAGATQTEVNKMSQAILDLAPKVGMGPDELAQGLYHLESAGFRGAQALDLLKAAAEGARIGNANLEDTTQAMIAITASHIKGVKDANDAMAILNATVGIGDMRMEGLAQAMSTGIVPTAATFGLRMQDVSAALATLTDNAVPPIDAATRLRMTISLMGAPSSTAAKALKEIGLSSTQLADDMRGKGLLAALEDLKGHLEAVEPATTKVVGGTKLTALSVLQLQQHLSNAQQQMKIYGDEHVKAGVATEKHDLAVTKLQQNINNMQAKLNGAGQTMVTVGGHALTLSQQAEVLTQAFGGGRSSAAILTMLDELDRLKSKYKDLGEGQKNFGNDWNATQQTATFNVQRFQATLQTLSVEFGAKLLPTVTKFLEFVNNNLIPGLTNLMNWVDKNRWVLAIIAGIIGAVLVVQIAAFVVTIGTAVTAIAAFVGATVAAVGWVIAIVAAVAAGVTLLILYWGNIKSAAIAVVTAVVKFFQDMWSGIKTVFRLIHDFFTGGDPTLFPNEAKNSALRNFAHFLSGLRDGLLNMVDAFKKAWEGVQKVFNSFLSWVTSTFAPAFNVAMKVVGFGMIVVHDIFVVAWFEIQKVVAAAVQFVQKWFVVILAFLGPVGWIALGAIALYQHWNQIWTAIQQTVHKFGVWLQSTFGPGINAIWNFIKTITSDLSNFFTASWDAIEKMLKSWGDWLGGNFVGAVNVGFNAIKSMLADLAGVWQSIWNGIKSFVNGIANDIMGIVKNMLNSIIGFFNNLISGANKVGSKIPGYIQIPQLPHFQTGGIVPGAIGEPALIVAHGGETIVPQGLSGNAGAGSRSGGTTFNVYIGLYAGSDTERRNVARKLYSALLQLAQSQHKTVAEYMGG